MPPSAPRRVPAWPSYALVLLVGACAVFAFSPRKPASFKPTAIAAEGLLVNAVLRQGGLFITAGEQGRILISPDPKGPWQEAVIKPQRGIPRDGRKIVTKAEREHTPPALAQWLVELARRAATRQEIAA